MGLEVGVVEWERRLQMLAGRVREGTAEVLTEEGLRSPCIQEVFADLEELGEDFNEQYVQKPGRDRVVAELNEKGEPVRLWFVTEAEADRIGWEASHGETVEGPAGAR